jgi:hypothetical protein
MDAMSCVRCGTILAPGTAFCPACGTAQQTTAQGYGQPTPPFGHPGYQHMPMPAYPPQPFMPAPPQRSNRAIIIGGVVAAALVLICLCGGGALVVGNLVNSECTVGYSGTDLSITIRGTGASQACDEMDDSSVEWYSMNGAPNTTVICTGKVDGGEVTVRDSGMFKVLGNSLCTSLKENGTLKP